MGMSQKEARERGLDVEWIGGVGWCGPDWQKAEAIDKEEQDREAEEYKED